MMKKIVVPFLIFLFLFSLGCNNKIETPSNNKIETPSENSIPFLTFSVNQKAGYVEVYLNYWDLAKGKILQTNKVLYVNTAQPYRTCNPEILDWDLPVHYYGPPLSWDGESYIYLSSQYHNVKNSFNFKIKMFDDPIDCVKYASGKIIKEYDFFNYSQNLQVQTKNVGGINYLKEKYGDFTFRVLMMGR